MSDNVISLGGRRASRKERIAELERENASLRSQLGVDNFHSLSTWERVASQETRDRMAALTWLQCKGHTLNALKKLGFNVGRDDDKGQIHGAAYDDLEKRVFDTPGVKAWVNRDLGDAEAAWLDMLKRQREIVLTGDDADSLRAFQQVAKVEGRYSETPAAAAPTINLYTLVGAGVGGQTGIATARQAEALEHARESSDPLALLSHEPSATGVRISSGEAEVNEVLEGDQ